MVLAAKDQNKCFAPAFIGQLCVVQVWTCRISGEDARDRAEVVNVQSINLTISSSPIYEVVHAAVNGSLVGSEKGSRSAPVAPPPPPPLPPTFFLGYTLPPGHPCNSFTLPPPPADKKRTGPRRKYIHQSIFTCCSC